MAANIRDALAPAIRKLRDSGLSWSDIGRELGITGTTAKMAVDPDYAARRRSNINARRIDQTSRVTDKNRVTPPSRLTAAEARKVIARIPPDTRTPMQKMLGDPLPGRSALDMRKELARLPELDHDHGNDVTHLLGREARP